MATFIEKIIAQAEEIEIVSGEGDGEGTRETFTGRKTERALRMRLNKERCGGDRWAFVIFDGERYDGGI